MRGRSWSLEPPMCSQAPYLANNKQPTGSKSPVLLSEFKHTIQLSVPAHMELPQEIGQSAAPPFAGLPVGAKLVSFQHLQQKGEPDELKTAIYGVFRTPEEFLQEACSIRHPFNIPVSEDVDNI